MPDYRVHFTFYAEQYGYFDEASFAVEADNTFEARRKAWLLSDKNEDMKFASNIKLCGITWNASPLNMQDYFNSLAAEMNYRLKYIENVELLNCRLQNNEESAKYYTNEKYRFHGFAEALSEIAKDIGKPYGMIPPMIYDELYYAEQLIGCLDQQGKYEQAQALWDRIEKAKAWDSGAMFDIHNMFRDGYTEIKGEIFRFKEHFGRDGIYPESANIEDNDYTYISRWQRAHPVIKLDRMPIFTEKDIIKGSRDMDFNYQYIVLNDALLEPEFRKPENMIWYVDPDSAGYKDSVAVFDPKLLYARNVITGEEVTLQKNVFVGVLRPEFVTNIDFDAIKEQYRNANPEKFVEPEVILFNEMEADEDDMDYEQ